MVPRHHEITSRNLMMKKSVMNSPSSLSLFYLLLVTILVSFNTSFRLKHGQSYQSASSALYYDYFKKGPEKVLIRFNIVNI